MTRLLALFAFLVFGGFLLILAMGVPRLDLVLIIGFTAALVAYDFVTSSGKKRD
jgi:hypothetical protein